MDSVESDERIISILYSISCSKGGLFSRNKECMLCLTNRRVAVIFKTEMKINR